MSAIRLTVLGGWGAWPPAGGACSGYLVEAAGFRCLVDPGYAVFPRLQAAMDPDELDAVVVTHRHPDHCADLNPLLRARALRDDPLPALAVYAPAGALDAVLALDRPGMLDAVLDLHEFEPGHGFDLGPLVVDTRLLPHFVPNAGLRMRHGTTALVYTGDAGPAKELVELARGSDLLLAEATFPRTVPADSRGALSSAVDAARAAREAGAGRLVLTHLSPDTDPAGYLAAAREVFDGPVDVSAAGVTFELG
jgi:ribonuclease BN (tRNA processing enzyme)